MKGIVFVVVQSCCLLQVRDGSSGRSREESGAELPRMDLGAVADRDQAFGSSWGEWGGKALLLRGPQTLLHGCVTGEELQVYHRVFQVLCEITTALRFSSDTTSDLGFSEIQGILYTAIRIEIDGH